VGFPYTDLYIVQWINDHPIYTSLAMFILEKAANKFIFAPPPLVQRDIRFVVLPADYQFTGNDVNFILKRHADR
jgi:hypothetical protein